MSTGSLLLALGDKQSQSMMMLGYFLLGVAGPFLQMPCFQFSELFGHRKASAMASLITCFELSTGVFWIFGQLHTLFQLDRTSLFLGYSGVGVYMLVTALLFWPDLPYRSPPPPHNPQVASAPLPRPAPSAALTLSTWRARRSARTCPGGLHPRGRPRPRPRCSTARSGSRSSRVVRPMRPSFALRSCQGELDGGGSLRPLTAAAVCVRTQRRRLQPTDRALLPPPALDAACAPTGGGTAAVWAEAEVGSREGARGRCARWP